MAALPFLVACEPAHAPPQPQPQPSPDASVSSVAAGTHVVTVVESDSGVVEAVVSIDAGVVAAAEPVDAGACADKLEVEYIAVRDPAMGQLMAMRIRTASWTHELTRDGGPMGCTTKVRGRLLEWQCSGDMGLAFGEVDVQSTNVVFREGFMTFGSPTRPPMKESARKPWTCPLPHFFPKNHSDAH